MEDTDKRLQRLLRAEKWSPEDELWMKEYLESENQDGLKQQALELYGTDMLEKEGLLEDEESAKILNRLHSHIETAKRPVKIRRWDWLLAMAASAVVLLSVGYFFRESRHASTALPAKFAHISTKKGEQKKVELEDGTQIWLNSASSLTYPAKFANNKREVTLLGEAYFNVKHISDRPFVIHTGKVVTNVLGTSFNIKAYKGDKNIEVAVLTGKVGVSVKGSASQLLVPNQQIVYNTATSKLAEPVKLAATEKILWTEGKLHFKNAPLPQVISDLQRKYNVAIAIDSNLANCTVYANFNNEPIGKVLMLLAETTNASIKKDDKGYRLQGTGCSAKQ